MKKIELAFYNTAPSKEDEGLKLVIWGITDDKEVTTYDWGFAYWNGTEFEGVETLEGYTVKVMRWANTVDPKVVLEDSVIIKPHS